MDQGISHMRSEYFRDLHAPKQVDEELDQILKLGSDAIQAGGRVLTDLVTHRGVDLSRWTVSISQDGRDVVLTRPDSQMQLAATPPTGSMANLTGIKFPLVVSGRKSVLAPESALPSSTAAEPDALSWPYIQLPVLPRYNGIPFGEGVKAGVTFLFGPKEGTGEGSGSQPAVEAGVQNSVFALAAKAAPGKST
jgi:hypothetical protein